MILSEWGHCVYCSVFIFSEWGDTEGLCGGLSRKAAEDWGAAPETEGSGGGEAQSVSVLRVRGDYSP